MNTNIDIPTLVHFASEALLFPIHRTEPPPKIGSQIKILSNEFIPLPNQKMNNLKLLEPILEPALD